MTLIEKFFQIKAQDPLPYCPRAFLQQIYRLAYRNQGFTIVKLVLPEQKPICYSADIKKGKVVFYTAQGGRRTATEIIGTAEGLKQELSMLMS
ncbi:hypothetical protein [Desulforamulus hydrothermalis]|uniref:Uncharacterized protein n=1 Tax=Desulforamulus hydrothermalis Lam5 = DSM 18033 TaxID=1121428 RepID=K8EE68_9FIRM|nr:hypothetical protein [Desulforamulus hydrothermalis]CCO07091.1 conserved hypothetical protein [Desulforamulus hydrothermalis Lam5 = DSM 18033]SHG90385.1 hypothetical protein SAMN02745177_00782 [Desulforamulus hydrothermalis Lam5 = DSM 18033]